MADSDVVLVRSMHLGGTGNASRRNVATDTGLNRGWYRGLSVNSAHCAMGMDEILLRKRLERMVSDNIELAGLYHHSGPGPP